MVALQRPQNRKMVALQRPKFAQKCLFLEIFAAPSTPRPILSFRTISYIKFDHILQQFLMFPHFRIFLQKWPIFRFFLKFGPPKHPKNHFLLHFSPTFFRKLVALQRPISKLVVGHPPPFWGSPPISISDINAHVSVDKSS